MNASLSLAPSLVICSREGVEQSGIVDAQAVIAVLQEEGILDLPPGTGAETDLFAAGLDSMAVMQLIVIVEERFGAVIGPEDTGRENLGTPAALAALISQRR